MIQRTLSLRVLTISVVLAVAGGGAALVVQRWQVSRTAKLFLAHAQKQEQGENWLKAAEYLERYLRLQPDDASVRERMATTFSQGAVTLPQKRQAVNLHFRALGASAGGNEVRLRERLAELLIETGRQIEAEQEARRVLAAEPANARAQRALALALWKQVADGSLAGKRTGQVGVVRAVLKARDQNPADVDLAIVAGTLYREYAAVVSVEFPALTADERRQLADESLDKVVAAGKADQKAWLARHLYRRQYGLEGADADLAQALAIAPDDPAVLMTAAADELRRAQTAAGEAAQDARTHYAKAKELYRRLTDRKDVPQAPEWHLGLGEAHLGLTDVDAALTSWRKGAKHFEQPTVVAHFQSRIADTLLAHQRYGEAESILKGLDALIDGLDASVPRERRTALRQAHDLRRATWYLAQNQPLAAVQPLRDVIARLGSSDVKSDAPLQAWLKLGQAYGDMGEWLEAAGAYDRAAVLAPNLAAAHAAAAHAWLLAGRPDLASERAEEAIAHGAPYTAWISLAAAQTQVQAALPPVQQSWSRCEQALDALDQAPPQALGDSPWKIALVRADYLVARWQAAGQSERGQAEALAVLQAAENRHPGDAAFLATLVPYYQQLGAASEADRTLARLQQLPTAGVQAAAAAARLAVQRKEFSRAKQLLESAAKSQPATAGAVLRSELIGVALAQRDFPLARSLLVRQHQDQPHHLLTIRRLAELDLETGNLAGLAEWEQKLAAIRPAGQALAGYYRTCLLLVSATSSEDPKLQAALTEQAQVTAQRPSWPEAISLRGMIEQRLGRLEAAAQAYEQAIELGERRMLVFEQLIGLLDQLNRPVDCEKYLSRLAVQVPLSQRLTELAGMHQVRTERPEEAVAIARQRVDRQPGDALARIWLGRLLAITGQPAHAQQEFQKAIELAPEDVRSWSGLFAFQLRRGEKELARKTLDQLVERVQLEPAQRNFVLGQGHELIGDLAEAERHYREAARRSPESGAVHLRLAGLLLRSDPMQAERSLLRALEVDPKSVVARRMLAVLLASRGGEEDMIRVEALLAETGSGERIASEDRRLKALLLAQKGGTKNLARAVKLLEELIDRGVGVGPSDHLILAQLTEALGRLSADPKEKDARFKAAREQLELIAFRSEAEPPHLSALIGFLLRHQQTEDAGDWLNKLEAKLAAAPRDRADAIAQLVSLRLQHGSAAGCGPWLDRLDRLAANPLQHLALQARWLAASGRGAEIEGVVEPRGQQLLAAAPGEKQRQKLQRELGDVYFGVSQFQAAERWYRLVEAADPAQFHLVASALAKQGKIGQAIDHCQAAAATDTTSQPAIVIAAVLVDNAPTPQDFQRAEPILVRALAQFGSEEKLLHAVGVLRIMQGRYDESRELFEKVHAINPKNVPAINNLAQLKGEDEDPAKRQEALKLIDMAIDISGAEADLLDTKGAILVYDGRSEQAVSLLEAAARSAGSDPRHSFHLAVAYHHTNRPLEARTQLQSALDRQLESQVLTPTDRRLLDELKNTLTPGSQAVDRP
jgi:tetratricopeptide (TPR) repeat protein